MKLVLAQLSPPSLTFSLLSANIRSNTMFLNTVRSFNVSDSKILNAFCCLKFMFQCEQRLRRPQVEIILRDVTTELLRIYKVPVTPERLRNSGLKS